MRTTFLCIFMIIATLVSAQTLENGPMVGYSTTRESVVWVQTKKESKVHLKYWSKEQPKRFFYSKALSTSEDHANTAHLIANGLEPGTTYYYQVFVNGIVQKSLHEQKFMTQPLWIGRMDAPDFKFAAGSCFYINEDKYELPQRNSSQDYKILNSIYKDQPQFMVWLGDNVYLREMDYDSQSGIYRRYTHTRKTKELQKLLSNTHHYAIWDDHDYGPNDSNRTYYGKNWTKQAFKDFWANPVYGIGDSEGITGAFSWNDADFFLMDNRWYRSAQSPSGQILGPTQLKYLIEVLQTSKAKFKFVCVGGQVLNTAVRYENHAVYAEERDQLLHSIDSLKIPGVIFVDGDRHHSEMSKWTGKNGTTVYDITTSPLTAGVGSSKTEINDNRIPGSMIFENNYAIISCYGPRNKRQVKVTYKNVSGDVLFDYVID